MNEKGRGNKEKETHIEEGKENSTETQIRPNPGNSEIEKWKGCDHPEKEDHSKQDKLFKTKKVCR